MQAAAQALPAAGERGGCVRRSGMTTSPSAWLLPRLRTTAHSARRRPGPDEPRLLDPPLLQGAATVGCVGAAGPLLVVPSLTGSLRAVLDSSSLRFPTAAALWQREERKKEMEEAEEAIKRPDEMKSLFAVPCAHGTQAQMCRLEDLSGQVSTPVASLPGRRRKKKKSLVAALIVDNGISLCLAGHAGSVLPQCHLRLLAGLSCQALWVVWTRMTVIVVCSSSIPAAACAMLVLLVRCSPRVVFPSIVGSRCSASWLVWTRRPVTWRDAVFVVGGGMCKASIVGFIRLALCFLLFSAGPDALHHGRYEPEGLLRGDAIAAHAQTHQHPSSWRRGIFPWSRLFCGPT